MRPDARCPCGSRRKYKRCCAPLHQGLPAPTPEALMRSRYCAYALHLVDYILDTTHPDGPLFRDDRAAWRVDVARFCETTRFERLDVLATGGDTVTFRAQLSQFGRDASFSECSTFARHQDRWCYHSGAPHEPEDGRAQ